MRALTRIYGVITVLSLTLAVLLVVTSGVLSRSGRGPATLGAPTPRAAAPVCSGVTLSGGHAGCLQFTEVTCRAARSAAVAGGQANPEDLITATGPLPGVRQAILSVTPTQTRLAITVLGATGVLEGPAPASFDLTRGSALDGDVGPPGSPDLTHLRGFVSCGA